MLQELRASGADVNYLLFGQNRRARLIQNYGNVQTVVLHASRTAHAAKPAKQGSTVCTIQ